MMAARLDLAEQARGAPGQFQAEFGSVQRGLADAQRHRLRRAPFEPEVLQEGRRKFKQPEVRVELRPEALAHADHAKEHHQFAGELQTVAQSNRHDLIY